MTCIRRLAPAALIASLAACGGATATPPAHPAARPHQSPAQAILTAVHLAATQSYRLDFTLDETLSAAGPQASRLGFGHGLALSSAGHIDAASSSRLTGTFAVNAAGHDASVALTVADGVAYLSTDGGASYKSTAFDASVDDQYGPDSALRYLSALGTVSDLGPARVGSLSVERYHATLDGAKTMAIIQSQLSSLRSGMLSSVLSTLQFQGGGVDAAIDSKGRLATEHATFAASIELGVFDASMAGTTMDVTATVDAHFHDYGAPITVTAPANVTGTTTLH